MKKIDLEITTYNLGDLANDGEGLNAYREAVTERLSEIYGEVEISVEFISGTDKDRASAEGFEDNDEVISGALQIAEDVFSEGNY